MADVQATNATTDIAEAVIAALRPHPNVMEVRLCGSRARGDAVPLSDWDFVVITNEDEAVRKDLPELVRPLEAISQQWDRLASNATYMLMLPGGVKVDLIFASANVPLPAWQLSRETIGGIDSHFWDWIIWLASKDPRGREELVREEFEKMSNHLLRPMGIAETPADVGEAVRLYREARSGREAEMEVRVDRSLEQNVTGALRRGGYRF